MFRSSRVPPVDHPSPKPPGLVARLIEVVTERDQVVLDPFVGSGTTLLAAVHSGRRGIGIESDERYCEIAAKRLDQGSLFAMAGAGPAEATPDDNGGAR